MKKDCLSIRPQITADGSAVTYYWAMMIIKPADSIVTSGLSAKLDYLGKVLEWRMIADPRTSIPPFQPSRDNGMEEQKKSKK